MKLFSVAPASIALVLLVGSNSASAKKEDSDGHIPPCEGSSPGWVDVDGMGCGWYERNEAPGCPIWGDYTGYDIVTRVKYPDINRVGVANNNCCHCRGTAVSELVEDYFPFLHTSMTTLMLRCLSSGSNCVEFALDFRANIYSVDIECSRNPDTQTFSSMRGQYAWLEGR